MRNATIALFLSLATGCASPSERSREIHDELVYFKDHRVDICYAYWISDSINSAIMTAVPCEKVAHLLTNGAEAGR